MYRLYTTTDKVFKFIDVYEKGLWLIGLTKLNAEIHVPIERVDYLFHEPLDEEEED